MIFRAVFWIGLVALLMPHEPDLGFGRPEAINTGTAAEVGRWAASKLAPNLKDPRGAVPIQCRRLQRGRERL